MGVGRGVVAMEVEETLGVGVSPRQSLGGVAWSFTRFAVCVCGRGGGGERNIGHSKTYPVLLVNGAQLNGWLQLKLL